VTSIKRPVQLGVAVAALLAVAACAPPSSNSSSSASAGSAATATSAADVGGVSALYDLAKKEGALNIIAIPPDWANYGAIIDGFKAKYPGITVNSANPNGSSQDEVNAIKTQAGTDRAPDVVDVGMKVAVANTSLFAPYQVATWKDIPDSQKESTGLWFQDYGGYMSIGYDSSKVPDITSVNDLTKPEFKGKVALNGDPTKANAALNGVMMAGLSQGGTLDDASTGVNWFANLNKIGNFVPIQATTATVKNGTTPVVFDWDYLSAAHGKDVPTWKVFVPSNAILGGYYAQAINKQAPHAAAARLWEEYLYSVEGQNLWLKGGARPVEMEAMTKAGTIDTAAAAALPQVQGTPQFMTDAQATAAGTYLSANWAKAVS
jgi:putative spermidine/putrescine transport system substrate-binding protein